MWMTEKPRTGWGIRALDKKREAARRRNHLNQLARGNRKPLPKYIRLEAQ